MSSLSRAQNLASALFKLCLAYMELLKEMKVRVKNTFLELVEDEEVQPRILKSQTDSLAFCSRQKDEDTIAVDGSALGTCGLAAATAAAAASAARAAAQAAAAAAVPQCLAAGGLPVDFGSLNTLEAVGELAQEQKSRRPVSKDAVQNLIGEEAEDITTAHGDDSGLLTTVMLRNLPNDYSRSMLVELMDSSGFEGRYDFLYLPTDFSRRAGLGYAFVNMVSPADAQEVRSKLEGYRQWSVPSSKVCSVGWSNPCQGLEANIERYRNSPIMHESVPEDFKPLLLRDGKRVQFPQPTKKLRKPDMGKHNRQKSHT